MKVEKIRKKVKKKLSQKRYIHTLGVEKKAVELALIYNENETKARVAALLHDYLKQEDINILKEMCKDIEEIKGYENLFEIYHGLGAEKILREKFKIDDDDIINAVKYHTIGRENMSLLEKIIYIADAIEDGRNYEGVEEIRKITLENLNEGMIIEIKGSIEYLKKNNLIIHENTRKLLAELEREKRS